MSQTVVMVMAGGKGSRLGPLTSHRAKPAVPFAGRYRIIDFVLSNFINSGYRRIYVLTQYMASSLIKHLNRNWNLTGMNEHIEIVPAQMRTGEHWYRGTADSVYQNLNLVRDSGAEHVAVFGGDHIYKFSINHMEEFHRDKRADLTVAAFPVPIEEANQFGVIQVDESGKIIGFQEKPDDPAPMPGDPTRCLVSMGNYFFRAEPLYEGLDAEVLKPNSTFDFGKGVIPKMVEQGASVYAYDFGSNQLPGEPEGAKPYWRDVGTIESYFRANMEVRDPLPSINLYNRQWRIRTAQRDYPPARFVRHGYGPAADIVDSLVCEGSIVSSAVLHRVMLGYDCFVHSGCSIENAVILSGCDIGAGSRLRSVLFDKNCSIAPGAEIGVDPVTDKARFPFISSSGIIVLPKGTHVPKTGPIELAFDMAQMLQNDPTNRIVLDDFEGDYTVSEKVRHSYASAGPRYRKFGPEQPIR